MEETCQRCAGQLGTSKSNRDKKRTGLHQGEGAFDEDWRGHRLGGIGLGGGGILESQANCRSQLNVCRLRLTACKLCRSLSIVYPPAP